MLQRLAQHNAGASLKWEALGGEVQSGRRQSIKSFACVLAHKCRLTTKKQCRRSHTRAARRSSDLVTLGATIQQRSSTHTLHATPRHHPLQAIQSSSRARARRTSTAVMGTRVRWGVGERDAYAGRYGMVTCGASSFMYCCACASMTSACICAGRGMYDWRRSCIPLN